MLEKIGLPPKPSLRGNSWVVDASHCHGCSSQFTFLNRKHHCRRCGGLFCNSCTSQRMILRGQGDSPVRICDPCKKLEDAARFELRHGRRSKTGKGSSKGASSNADEVLNQILVDDDKGSHPVQSSREINSEDGDMSLHGNAPSSARSEMESSSPEELRQQALEEKNNYKLLKGEGKSAEAMKAFKRAKELERQAAALELQLRKNQRKASTSSSMTETLKMEDVSSEGGRRDKPISQKGKDKDDLTAELRELGWSDMDIHDRETKPVTTTLEGELLSLLGHDKKTIHNKASSGLDKSQVVALKKKALMFKREGKLAEAKEELKRAKILEKQLEEQELLDDAEDSDDELSALIRSLDNDKQNDRSFDFNLDSTFDLSGLSGFGGDVGIDGNFEVTDYDMHDPEMAAALQTLGWTEEPVEETFVDREALADEILNLKKEAVKQKRSGNMAEAMSLLKKAKGLEKDLDGLDSVASHNEKAPEVSKPTNLDVKPPKSRLMIQKELLALKKKALALRREGKIEEADEELKKGKILEQQLEEMDTTPKTDTKINASSVVSGPEINHIDLSTNISPADEDGDVTDQDLHDPAYLSLLRNLGWQEEDNVPIVSSADRDSKPMTEATVGNTDKLSTSVKVAKPRRSKAEIQRELLGLKRKALALRRQGNEAEAEEVLASAKGLEEQLAEMEMPKNEVLPDFSEPKADADSSKTENPPEVTHTVKVVAQTPLKRAAEVNGDDLGKRQVLSAPTEESNPSPSVSPDGQKSPLQQEILAHKRKALAFKREGKLAEARAELRKAKLLENSMGEDKPESTSGSCAMDVSSSVDSTASEEHDSSIAAPQKEQDPPHPAPKLLSSHERFKLQRECLSHKRNALRLRREGKTEEADAELELAKKLESQLEEASPHDSAARASSEAGPAEDAGIEDLFDPQLLSALKAIGLQDAHVAPPPPVKAEQPTSSSSKNNTSTEERAQLESQIKAEKVKALNLKRTGKQKEALDALRRAKQMEKKLNSLTV